MPMNVKGRAAGKMLVTTILSCPFPLVFISHFRSYSVVGGGQGLGASRQRLTTRIPRRMFWNCERIGACIEYSVYSKRIAMISFLFQSTRICENYRQCSLRNVWTGSQGRGTSHDDAREGLEAN